jgi:dTDP-4-dehydrorhamnose 3,5-epimerase
MQIVPTHLPGVVILEPRVFGDSRGFFLETWNLARYVEAGISDAFVQDNLSLSARGVVRGLHFQNPRAQAKLVTVLQGEVYDVAVDIRVGSPTFGKWVGVHLTGENKRQLYVPRGFAHGFCVTSETALFMYKCSDFYDPESEGGVAWNDPDLGIDWPVDRPSLSGKDAQFGPLKDVDRARLPVYARPK